MHRAAPKVFTQDDLSLGHDNVSNPMALDYRSLYDCKNVNLTFFRGVEKRDGISKLYSTSAGANPIKSLYEYKAPNGTAYVLATLGTVIRTYYSAAWHDLKTVTSGKKFSFVTHLGFCYAVNGVDPNIKFYNTTAYGVGIAPPASAPTVADGGAGALTGKYKYVYCYERSTPRLFIGNPSSASAEISVTSKKIKVSVVHSTDPQVDKIIVYRTFNLLAQGSDSTQFFKVTELTNADQDYLDETSDANLGALCTTDNTVPPKAKWVVLHKDHVFYVNCPDEDCGTSLVMWSKSGMGEAVPSANYQYFDRDDGEPITGAASLGDYFVVFKRNKIAVIEGNFQDLYTASDRVGCVAPWAILVMADKIIFLSEEGWKSFDGKNLRSISKKINGYLQEGYVSILQQENYSAVYYPLREQFHFLMNHSVNTPIVIVGHFLIPMLAESGTVTDEGTDHLISWTYHQYDYHALTCLATYTDAGGITRIIAGNSDGYVYLLDSGPSDDEHDIHAKVTTGWISLGVPASYQKTVRMLYITYATDEENAIKISMDVDGATEVLIDYLYGVDASYCGYCYCGYTYCGMEGSLTELIRLLSTGTFFRYNIENNNQKAFRLVRLMTHFRVEGNR